MDFWKELCVLDSITLLIKNEIKAQYKSVRKFSEESGIPYSTLSNALSKGVGGTSYDTVVKICQLLDIKQSYDEDIVLFNNKFHDIYSKLTMLDERGLHTICAVLDVEYARCTNINGDPIIKAFNGVGYANKQLDDSNREKKVQDDE